ncbi:MAG TPA: 3-deoxy-D-manno-octulosonic acid transferase [Terriglobales bacterium]|nr:3-deoxy-D-manno-octulosonic acid transferase [Terriglobales bacterium]
MYLFYSVLLAIAFLCGTPYWLYEIFRHGKYRRGLTERLGFVPRTIVQSAKPCIWIHAVSVGEVLAVSEVVRRLQNEFPAHRVVISTTTDTGQKLAKGRFGDENVFYFPFDFQFCVTPYLKALHPELIVIAETEFWPNFLRAAKLHGAQIVVINARISDRSLPGYRRWRSILSRVLRNIDLFLAQTPEDAHRLNEIGAPDDRVFVAGNLKFDVPAPIAPPIVNQLRTTFADSNADPILVCGSTVEGEEPLLLNAFKDVLPRFAAAVMILAPRHPERFAPVAELIEKSKLKFWKRSTWNNQPLTGGVFLVDSIGELASLYALADIAFVGGSLVARGGHSILEPARHGVAILVGPHTENFRDIVELFRRNEAVRIVTADDLSRTLLELLANDDDRFALGRRALQTLQSQSGATQFTLDKLQILLHKNTREAHSA